MANNDPASKKEKEAVWSSERGKLRVWHPAPGVMADVVEGYLDLELARHLISESEREITAGRRIIAFHDWLRLEGYDTKARVELTDWTTRVRTQVEMLHTLVSSKLVAMGISVANLALGGILRSYTSRAEFEKALQREISRLKTSS